MKIKQLETPVDWNWMKFEAVPDSVDVQMLGTVAAGQPIEAVPYRQTISIPKDMVGRFQTYALRVEGNSMVVVVRKQPTAENGETVVAMINNEEVTLKKLYIEPDHIRLQPANPEMKPIILRNHEIRILGIVCGVTPA